jgi:hypothetical protein
MSEIGLCLVFIYSRTRSTWQICMSDGAWSMYRLETALTMSKRVNPQKTLVTFSLLCLTIQWALSMDLFPYRVFPLIIYSSNLVLCPPPVTLTPLIPSRKDFTTSPSAGIGYFMLVARVPNAPAIAAACSSYSDARQLPSLYIE